jgi:pimeloyl-ACP methyl ester carboxylesterase
MTPAMTMTAVVGAAAHGLVLLAAAPLALAFPPVDPEGKDFAYPYPVHSFALESQRQHLQMAYLDERPAQPNGRTVLLLHGKNFSAAYWAPTIAALTAAGFRVIAPDQVGFGKSSKPERYQFSFAGLAANTAALLQSLDINRVSVVGHSMGGMLAVRFARRYPARVERLALVSPLGLEDYGAALGERAPSINAWFAREKEQTPEKLRDYQRKTYFAGEWKPEYDDLIKMQAGFTRHPQYERVAWDSALLYDMILTQPVVSELDQLRVPTLLMVGARDRTAVGKDLVPAATAARMGDMPALARAAAGRIPGAHLVELPTSGHLPQIDAFARYREELLRFLTAP